MIPIHSAHGPIASSADNSGFDPLYLPNLIWFVHPDDYVLVGGDIDSIPDRVAGYNFAAQSTGQRLLLNTSMRSPHAVATAQTSGVSGDRLVYNNATLAQSITANSTEYTIFSLHNYEVVSLSQLVGHSNTSTGGATGGSIWMRKSSVSSAAAATLRTAQGGAATDYTWVAADGYTGGINQWESWVFTHDSSGNVSFYLNGSFVSTKAGTLRDTTGLLYCYYGAGGNGGASTEVHYGPQGVCNGILTADEISSLHSWLLANS